MSDVDHYHISIIAHCLQNANQSIISATLPRYADIEFPHEMYAQYKIGELIRARAPDNEEAQKLLKKVDLEAQKWEEFMVIARAVGAKITDENIARIVPYLESEHKLKVTYTLKALMNKNVFLHHIVTHNIEEKVQMMDQEDKTVKLMQEKIKREIQSHKTINEFIGELEQNCHANGTTLREVFETKRWHLLNDNSEEGKAKRKAEEQELLELCGFGPVRNTHPKKVEPEQHQPVQAPATKQLAKTKSFALTRTKRSERFPMNSDVSETTVTSTSSGYSTHESSSSEPSTSGANSSKLQKYESIDVFED